MCYIPFCSEFNSEQNERYKYHHKHVFNGADFFFSKSDLWYIGYAFDSIYTKYSKKNRSKANDQKRLKTIKNDKKK